MQNLNNIIQYIITRCTELKNKFTNEYSAPIEFVCVFCQNEKEYRQFTDEIEQLGNIVETTPSGFTYLLRKSINTTAGSLRLVKIRKPDKNRTERGDADFNTNYYKCKKKYQGDPRFELIKRDSFEMLRLSNPDFDVMACFSSISKSKMLGLKIQYLYREEVNVKPLLKMMFLP